MQGMRLRLRPILMMSSMRGRSGGITGLTHADKSGLL